MLEGSSRSEDEEGQSDVVDDGPMELESSSTPDEDDGRMLVDVKERCEVVDVG